MRRLAIISTIATLLATQCSALAIADCTRTTHVSHGGQADHMDLGEGRVMWRDWWSQEGTATNFTLLECATGAALTMRSQEENMGTRTAFFRTGDVLDILDRHQSGARVFATFDRIAADLKNIARDVEHVTLADETCACAAAYPELRGTKTEFVLAG